MVDDTGFPKDGTASPCVARQYSGTLGKTANCQVGVSVHLVNEHASCAADWRLFCPEIWDDAARPMWWPAAAAAPRERARTPDEVRHTEKWRLALEMIDEMAGPGRVGRAGAGQRGRWRPAGGGRDAGYGDNTGFRLELEKRDWRYVVAVKGTTSAHGGDAQPVTRSLGGGPGRPAQARLPRPAGEPAASSPSPAPISSEGHLAAGHQGHQGQPRRRYDQPLPGDPGPSGQPGHPPPARRQPAGLLAAGRMAPRGRRAHRLLAIEPARQAFLSPNWCAWPRSGGGSSTTTASSSTASGWTTSKAAPSPGWHRHVTLAVLAQAFCTKLRTNPKVPAPG